MARRGAPTGREGERGEEEEEEGHLGGVFLLSLLLLPLRVPVSGPRNGNLKPTFFGTKCFGPGNKGGEESRVPFLFQDFTQSLGPLEERNSTLFRVFCFFSAWFTNSSTQSRGW